MSESTLHIAPDGTIRFVYAEALDPHALGPPTITRASHVEPDAAGRWHADLTPVSGPVLGPYPSRSAALAAELSWLSAHWPPRA